jgi:hypothetical protein
MESIYQSSIAQQLMMASLLVLVLIWTLIILFIIFNKNTND